MKPRTTTKKIPALKAVKHGHHGHGGQNLARSHVTPKAKKPKLSSEAQTILVLTNAKQGENINLGVMKTVVQSTVKDKPNSFNKNFRQIAGELHHAGYKIQGFSTRKNKTK